MAAVVAVFLASLLAVEVEVEARDDLGDRRLDFICPEDSPQYSGWLPAGPGNSYFYWLAESRSARPHDDPLILWMTGGPGCSSSLAALSENGPCKVKGQDEEGRWITEKRADSWTEVANVIWVDQPGGVGFSDHPAVAGLQHNEHEVAENMMAFLRSFYKRYPQFAKAPLHIIGESYAGHYVPAVAHRVMRESDIPLTGIGIGNGLVSPMAQFMSKAVFARTGGAGGSLHGGVVDDNVFAQMTGTLPKCVENIAKCQASSQRDTVVCMNAYLHCTMGQMAPVMETNRNPYDLRKMCEAGPPLCYNETKEIDFMNDRAVQHAFGLAHEMPWTACNMTVTQQFVMSGDYFVDFRPQVTDLLANGIGVLVYSGDDDFMVDWLGTRIWMDNLTWTFQNAWKAAPNHGFYINGEKHGMVKTSHGLTFVQIYNAGHLVPMDQPQAALEMIRHFVAPSSPWVPQGAGVQMALAALDGQATWGNKFVAAVLCLSAAIAAASRRRRTLQHDEGRQYWLMA